MKKYGGIHTELKMGKLVNEVQDRRKENKIMRKENKELRRENKEMRMKTNELNRRMREQDEKMAKLEHLMILQKIILLAQEIGGLQKDMRNRVAPVKSLKLQYFKWLKQQQLDFLFTMKVIILTREVGDGCPFIEVIIDDYKVDDEDRELV